MDTIMLQPKLTLLWEWQSPLSLLVATVALPALALRCIPSPPFVESTLLVKIDYIGIQNISVL